MMGLDAGRAAGGAFGSKDVVPVDERTRDCGEGGTTSGLPETYPAPKTLYPLTKEQGIAGREAPRPARRPVPEKAPELGARGTEEQGFARNRAPRPRRPAPASQSPRAGRPKK